MARTTSRQAAAMAIARERRRALDRERDEHDARIEERTAEALVVLERRAVVERELATVTVTLGDVLRSLLAEDLTADRVAALVDLEVTEVRRLTKPATANPRRKNGTTDNQESPDLRPPTELRNASPTTGG